MTDRPALVWLRHDLRLDDNPALAAARKTGAPVIPVFIMDESIDHAPGAASRWWLHHSLASLGEDLDKLGSKLVLRRGEAAKLIPALVEETKAEHVFWNRRYHQAHIDIDKTLKSDLCDDGVNVETFNGNLLREPWELKTGSGGYYKVFTPFWKALKQGKPARADTEAKPRKIETPKSFPRSDKLKDWDLLPTKPDWAKGFEEIWTPGETGARAPARFPQ